MACLAQGTDLVTDGSVGTRSFAYFPINGGDAFESRHRAWIYQSDGGGLCEPVSESMVFSERPRARVAETNTKCNLVQIISFSIDFVPN